MLVDKAGKILPKHSAIIKTYLDAFENLIQSFAELHGNIQPMFLNGNKMQA